MTRLLLISIIILSILTIINQNIIYLYYLEYTPKKVSINGELVHNEYINEIYVDGSIYFIGKVLNMVNNNLFINYLKYSQKYPQLFYKFKYEYTKNLILNNKKINGNFILIKYLPNINIVFFEHFVTLGNINNICDQIINYTKITNNKLVFVDYFINTKTSKLYIKSIQYNTYESDARIYNIYNLIYLLINNKKVIRKKKELYYIIGIVIDLINNIKICNSQLNINNYINSKSNSFFKNIKKKDNFPKISKKDQNKITKEYIINGLEIEYTDINKIKEIIQKSNIPQINIDFLKNNYIGEGLFSTVYKNGSKIIKIYKKDYTFNNENIDEYNISKKINNIKKSNKYFPKFYRCFICKNKDEILICLEYDYINGVSIKEFLKNKLNLTSNKFLKMINNIITANKFLNDNKIERRDNHINNIMITDELNIKYIDLGRTFINTDKKYTQLDIKNYFHFLIKLSIITLEVIDNFKKDSKKQFILIKLIQEFSNKLSLL